MTDKIIGNLSFMYVEHGNWLSKEHRSQKEIDQERKQYAVKYLRCGEELPQSLRNAIADLIENKRPAGRPKSGPSNWLEVGQYKEENPEATLAQIAKKFGIEEKTVKLGIKHYAKAKKANDKAIWDAWDD